MVWIPGLWSGNHPPPIASRVFSGNDGPAIKCDRMVSISTTANCDLGTKRRHLFGPREIKPVNGDFYFPPPFEKYMAGHCSAFSLACLFA